MVYNWLLQPIHYLRIVRIGDFVIKFNDHRFQYHQILQRVLIETRIMSLSGF